MTIPHPTAFLALAALCVAGTPGHANAQPSVPRTERATRPRGAVLGLHAGSEVTDESDHVFIGGRAAFPLVWRSLLQLSMNWHLPGGDDFGEGTIAVRVHPLPTELYVAVGVGARTETDLVTGNVGVDVMWLAGLGFQINVWRVWPYVEAQIVNADPVLKLLGGVALPLDWDR